MKLVSFLAGLLLLSTSIHAEESWKIVKKSPFFSYSADFDFQENETSQGKVVRTGFLCPRYFYDLFDKDENFEARGKTRIFSLGLLDPSVIDIDVYDSEGFIGSIHGKLWTRSRAKFSFSDASGKDLAFAFLNSESSNFIIVSAENQTDVLAKLKGETFGDSGLLELKFTKNASLIDPRLMKIFCAYVSDYHEEFLSPPKKVIHYEYHYTRENQTHWQ